MDPLSITASAIAILQISGAIINVCYDYRARVKKALKDASRIIQELNGLRDVIDSLFQIIEKEAEGGKSESSALAILVQDNGPLALCKAELLEVKRKLEPNDGWRATVTRLMWPLRESDVMKVLQTINNTKSTIQLALAADQRGKTLTLQSGIDSLSRQFASSSLSSRQEQIIRWLSAPDPISNHNTARKKFQPNTGLWFINSPQFKQWENSPNSFFWIYGIPGCGKTILCSTIIDNLDSFSRDSMGTALTYFYFDFNDREKRTVESLLRSLITQLFVQQPNIPSELDQSFENKRQGASQLNTADLKNILPHMTKQFRNVYVVLDALDECLELIELLYLLKTLQSWGDNRLHIVVASRQLSEIEAILTNLTLYTISIQESSIGDDIGVYLTERLNTDHRFLKWPPHVRDQIMRILSMKAGGMFRWIVCQLDTLRNCLTLDALHKQLSILPRNLEDTYENILLQIDVSNQVNVLKILQWLAFSARPVKIEEIAEVLAIDLNSRPGYHKSLKLFDPQDVTIMCSSLITTATAPKGFAPIMPQLYDDYEVEMHETIEFVQLAHLSIKDYLLSDGIGSSKTAFYATCSSTANTFMAQTCLLYLMHPSFSTGHCEWDVLQARLNGWPLLHYAAHYWLVHVQAIGDALDPGTWYLIQQFFATRGVKDGGNYAAWAGVLTPEIESDDIQRTDPLYYAASFGTLSVVRKLIETDPGIDIDALGGRYGSTALQVACYRDHPAVVKLLLDAGADPAIPNRLGETCMFWAQNLFLVEITSLLKKRSLISFNQDSKPTIKGNVHV